MKHKEDTHNGIIIISGFVSLLVFAVTLAWLNSYFYTVRDAEIHEKVLAAENPKKVELRIQETALLSSYGWIDKEKGIARIPIDRAMEIMIEESQGAENR